MTVWFRENVSTILICAVLFAAVAVVIFSMVRNKRKGKSSCGCGCQDCALSGSCHSKK